LIGIMLPRLLMWYSGEDVLANFGAGYLAALNGTDSDGASEAVQGRTREAEL